MKTMRLSDGGELAYRESGSGQPLLVIHGWGLSGAAFSAQLRTLGNDFRVIVPDLRGHGQSSDYQPGGFGRLADDLAELIDGLAAGPAVVVGWSLGALVAWDLALRHGAARTAGVLSVDMVPRLLNDDRWPHGLREGAGRAAFVRSMGRMRSSWSDFTRVFVPKILAADGPRDAEMLGWLYGIAEANRGSSMAEIWGDMVEQDICATLPAIDAPCLHIYGERSQLYQPAAATWLAEHVPGLQVIAFEESGHAPHLEEPHRFDRTITEFARSAAHAAVGKNSRADAGPNRIH
ncbi:MAG: alpha/beta hydrolase [Pseudomonadota bacterium]